jgi:hypothetical protein
VFQLHEHRLRELGGSPRQALDPVWNIKAAHALWKRTRDFTAWGCIRYETAVATAGSP